MTPSAAQLSVVHWPSSTEGGLASNETMVGGGGGGVAVGGVALGGLAVALYQKR